LGQDLTVPFVDHGDLLRMRDALFFEGPESTKRFTRFWVLLILASVIATAGVIADSTATVIGAMIVAPLMTPILGIVLAIGLGDRTNLIRSVALVVAGAAAVVTLAWLLGWLSPIDVIAPGNSQVAARISPRIIDLVAAVATGAVGAFALVRSDVSDTLPGVAIAISLVPPLAVAGLTLEAGHSDQARGALLLFLTNVAAILLTGAVVMALYHVRRRALADRAPGGRTVGSRYPVVVIVAFVVIIAIPLVTSGRRFTSSTLTTNSVASVANGWASAAGWEIISAEYRDGVVVVRADGPEPAPDPARLRHLLDLNGQKNTSVRLELVPITEVDLPAA
jgi:uncharacterized hydrophobic protein (TIGR00271 family)